MEQHHDPFFEVRCMPYNMRRKADLPDVIGDTIIAEHVRAGATLGYGLGPLKRLLFWGPPGCGKGFAAELIASELEMYLVTLNLDEPLDPLLIRALLPALNPRVTIGSPVIVLVKGLDTALADNSGAAQRVSNTVLNWMESGAGGNIAIITATNWKDVARLRPRTHIDASIYFDKPQVRETP